MPTEATARAEFGDQAALIARLRPALVAFFLRRCRDPAEAEDLAQDVMLRALTHARWICAEQARSYIFRIAVNCWRDRGRRLLTRGIVVDWNDEITLGVAAGNCPERVLSGKQELECIVTALRELSQRTRDIFVLCRLEKMKQADIARLMGISVSAVGQHLAKALAHLARRTAPDEQR
jgi:RNA polymerase sigma-70 factor (ECF subfamily)